MVRPRAYFLRRGHTGRYSADDVIGSFPGDLDPTCGAPATRPPLSDPAPPAPPSPADTPAPLPSRLELVPALSNLSFPTLLVVFAGAGGGVGGDGGAGAGGAAGDAERTCGPSDNRCLSKRLPPPPPPPPPPGLGVAPPREAAGAAPLGGAGCAAAPASARRWKKSLASFFGGDPSPLSAIGCSDAPPAARGASSASRRPLTAPRGSWAGACHAAAGKGLGCAA